MKSLVCIFALWALPVFAQNARELVAAVLVAEAGGEGTNGLSAVAEVIARRMALDGKTPSQVVRQPKQFSVLNGKTPAKLWAKSSGHPLYSYALWLADVLASQPEALPHATGGADHFTRSDEKPYWARGKRPVAVIGNHSFYRLRRPS